MNSLRTSVAVIGAGVAGSAAAHTLALAGHSVHVFDKARGVGGRLATRRIEWADGQGRAVTTRLDHGAVGFSISSPAFQAFATSARHAGWLDEWRPQVAAGSLPLEGDGTLYVPTPDMPALCRGLLKGVPISLSCAVDGLHRGPRGWQVLAGSECHASTFDSVVLALPPAQAASLLNPHRLDWARHASIAPMQPCWTLMGVAEEPEGEAAWGLARPSSGLLAWVLRNDTRPGRARAAGQAHWVAHARTGWSRRHLEQPAAWVQQQMQLALDEYLGRPVDWQQCAVHRWRYALPQAHGMAPTASFWWDAAQGLGVCGDFLGGGGVEGAWLSAQALCTALLERSVDAADGVQAATALGSPAAAVAAGPPASRRLAA